MKIALYKNVTYSSDLVSVFEIAGWIEGNQEYARISEIIDVEFPMLARADIVANEIKGLDVLRAEVAEEFGRKLAAIDQRKSELLALTQDVA